MKRCKNCLLPKTYPKISFNSEGICCHCQNNKPFISKNKNDKKLVSNKIKLKEEFENFIEKSKGKRKYDCLLLFSGGKDSTYLLYLLTKEYGLNVLALTVETGLGSTVGETNAKKITKKLGVDHIVFTPVEFYKRLYCYLLTHPEEKKYSYIVCKICQNVIQSAGLNIASEKKIPFIVIGHSPDQTSSHELTKEELCQSWMPKEIYNEPFFENDYKYFWNPENANKEYTPRFIFPFYFLEYPNPEKIIKILTKLGIETKRKLKPIRTNCYLHWLLMYLDIVKYGYNPYTIPLSDSIRSGKTSRWKGWLIIALGNYLLKYGFIKKRTIKYVLSYLNLKIEDILPFDKNISQTFTTKGSRLATKN